VISIIHISTQKHWRGGENQLYLLCRELYVLGIKQTLLCPKDSSLEKKWREENWPCSAVSKRYSFDFRFIRNILKLARENPNAIIHLHDSHAHQMAVIVSAVFGLQNNMVLHRRVVFPIGHTITGRWKYNHDSVKAIIAISEAVANVMRNSLKTPRIIHTVYDAAEPPVAMKKNIRAMFNIPPEARIIGCVGALSGEKGHAIAIKSIGMLKHRNVVLLILGEGEMRAELESLARDSGLANRVLLPGFVHNAASFIAQFDIFVFPSLQEGLGTSLMEAMWSKTPVIASDTGGISELIVHEETGLLVHPGDVESLASAIERLLEVKDLRNTLTANARDRVEDFTPGKMAKETLSIYLEINSNNEKK
jgi:L-malate glycosyltransferase